MTEPTAKPGAGEVIRRLGETDRDFMDRWADGLHGWKPYRDSTGRRPGSDEVLFEGKWVTPYTAAILEERARREGPSARMTKVVNLKHAPYDVYIGRENRRYGLAESKWHNPYVVGKDGTRDECIEKYEAHLEDHPELIADLHELKGKVLGCWCVPKPCHGDVLARLADEVPIVSA